MNQHIPLRLYYAFTYQIPKCTYCTTAGGLRNGNAGICQHLENMIKTTEISAFSSCHLPFCFTRGREVLFKVMAIENTCKNKLRKVPVILVPSFSDELLLQGLEKTAGIRNCPNSNLKEQNGHKDVRWSTGYSLITCPPISQLEHRREQSQGAAAGGAGISQCKQHLRNRARC